MFNGKIVLVTSFELLAGATAKDVVTQVMICLGQPKITQCSFYPLCVV